MELRPGYKQTEVGVIPEDWDCTPMASIVREISMGPFGSDIKVSNFVSNGVPVLSGLNVRTERLVDTFRNFVTPAKARSLKKAVASRGDIVVTHRGTLGQISFIPQNSKYGRYVISQSQFRVRLDSDIVWPAWVVLFFHTSAGQRLLLEGRGHTGVPAIAQATTSFRKLFVPLPTKAEQEAIAAVLSDADALIESLEQLIAKKRRIKQGAMQELLTGKTRLPGFETKPGCKQTEVGVIPEDWGVQTIGQTAPLQRGFDLPNGKLRQGPHPVVYSNGILNSHDVAMISGPGVVTGRSGTLGSVHYVADDFWPHNTTLWVTRFNNNHPRFVAYLYEWIGFIRFASGSGVPTLNRNDAHSFILCIPPTKGEQEAIAAVLSDMDAEIEAVEAKAKKARQIKLGMMHELLTGRIRLI